MNFEGTFYVVGFFFGLGFWSAAIVLICAGQLVDFLGGKLAKNKEAA